MSVYMRNAQTGEVREVEPDSDEFAELKEEVYDHDGSARPKWEQTGQHHVHDVEDRAQSGQVRDEDLGHEDRPLPTEEVDVSDVGPEPNPHLALTPGEVEAGLTPDQKAKELGESQTDAGERRAEKLSDSAGKVGRKGRRGSAKSRRAAAKAGQSGQTKGQSSGAGGGSDGE